MSSNSPSNKGDLTVFKEILSNINTPLKKSWNIYHDNKTQLNIDHSGQLNRNTQLIPTRSLADNSNSFPFTLPGVFFSPSTNLINSSPNSIEKWFETYSREKINVMKLIKCNHDGKNKIKSKENSRHSSAKDHKKKSNNSSNLLLGRSKEINQEKNFSEEFFAKKNLMKLFDNNNNFISVLDNDETELNLLNNKTQRIQTEEYSDQECLELTDRKPSHSNLHEILSSPVRKASIESTSNLQILNTESRISSNSKKKQIFICSEQKSISTSGMKSSCPTLNSSEKKDRRRLRKTSSQLDMLHATFQENFSKDWNKEMICEIASRIGLEETKVYKWLWDKKNKQMTEKRLFIIQSDSKADR